MAVGEASRSESREPMEIYCFSPEFTQAIDDLDAARESIGAADIIFGVDVATGKESLFYDIATLKRVVRRDTGEQAKVLRVPVNFSLQFDDLECLIAMVRDVKGACCYE